MTINDWLKSSQESLQVVNIGTARLDTEVLLTDTLKKNRTWIHANQNYRLNEQELKLLNKQVERRRRHEPLAYIRGKQEFYGREFFVSPDTLTPRPETETMVEMALGLLKNNEITSVADIGAGSGCIIISLKLESNSKATFTGYEISKKALEIARKNATKFKANVVFAQTDIQKEDNGWQQAQLVVANLPYVPDNFQINLAASHEPAFAIFGGEDGLDYYRTLFSKLSESTKYVLAESLPPQHKKLEEIANQAGLSLAKTQDLIQEFQRK